MINIQRGSVWYTKSVNEYEDEYYSGMTYGRSKILIMSYYEDSNTVTYLKFNIHPNKNTYPILVKDFMKNIDISQLYTCKIEALDEYYCTINNQYIRNLITKINERKIQQNKLNKISNQQCIKKFGINVYVTENENVYITDTKRLILSEEAKNDIIYNSKTDNDIRILCDKYQIFPGKAIKEIRNRLIYQHKQKEG